MQAGYRYISCIQRLKYLLSHLSINPNLSFKRQYEIGKSLSSLREENVLIIGSGGIVHNLEHIQYHMHVVEGWAIHFIEWMEEKIVNWDLEDLFHFQAKGAFCL